MQATKNTQIASDVLPEESEGPLQVILANQIYSLGTGESDSLRRKAFFERGEQMLTEDEEAILKALGMQVGDAMVESLRPYLAKFFDALPGCQTDVDLYLKKDCEVPYFVLWSILFGDYAQTEKRLSERLAAVAAPSATNLDIAQSASALMRMGVPAVAVPATVPVAAVAAAATAVAPVAAAVPAMAPLNAATALSDDALIRKIFTLAKVGK
jgi:hypothetical protein